MGIPKLRKTAEQVNSDYARSQDDRECTPLSHKMDTSGSCQCGFFIDNKPGGTFPMVPNRRSRRIFSSFKPDVYVKSEEDIQRMQEERDRDEARREVRKLARLSRRAERKSKPVVTVDLLVRAENGSSTDGESQVD